MLRVIAARAVKTIFVSMLTEKFIINVVFLLLDWLVNRYGNDLTRNILNQLKDTLDKDHGTPKNLYNEIKFETKK